MNADDDSETNEIMKSLDALDEHSKDLCSNCAELESKIAILANESDRKKNKMYKLKEVIGKYDIAHDELFELLQTENNINFTLHSPTNQHKSCVKCNELRQKVMNLTQISNGINEQIKNVQQRILKEKMPQSASFDHVSTNNTLHSLMREMKTLKNTMADSPNTFDDTSKFQKRFIDIQKGEKKIFANDIREMKLSLNEKEWKINTLRQENNYLHECIDQMKKSQNATNHLQNLTKIMQNFIKSDNNNKMNGDKVNDSLMKLLPKIVNNLNNARMNNIKLSKENDESEKEMIDLTTRVSQKLQKYERDIKRLHEENDGLLIKNNKLQSIVFDTDHENYDEFEKISQKMRDVKKENKKLKNVNDVLKQQIDLSKKNESEYQRMSEISHDKLKHAQSYIQTEQHEMQRKNVEIEALMKENERLKNDLMINASPQQSSAEVIELEQKLDKINKINISLKNEINEIKQENEKNKEQIARSYVIEVENALEMRQLALEQMQRNEEAMSDKLQQQKEQNEHLNDALRESKQKMKDLEETLRRRSSEFDLLSECVGTMEIKENINDKMSDVDDQNAELSITRDLLRETEYELEERNGIITDLQIKLSLKDNDLRLFKETGNKLKNEINGLFKEMKERNVKRKSCQSLCTAIVFGGLFLCGCMLLITMYILDDIVTENETCGEKNSIFYRIYSVLYWCGMAAGAVSVYCCCRQDVKRRRQWGRNSADHFGRNVHRR